MSVKMYIFTWKVDNLELKILIVETMEPCFRKVFTDQYVQSRTISGLRK